MKNKLLFLTLAVISLGCENINQETDSTHVTDTAIEAEISTITLPEVAPAKIDKDLSAIDFKAGMEKDDILLIDVRTPEEFATGSIEGAVNIDFLAPDFADQIAKLEKDKPVYLFCKSGGRSGQAKPLFFDQGFTEVYNLIGGYTQWPY